ncbi:MAG: LOG family protein, partial [Candidatus Omnitrophica bacterium]|nr:LOG family protein [Candidatus Omnitrophota bacterium]
MSIRESPGSHGFSVGPEGVLVFRDRQLAPAGSSPVGEQDGGAREVSGFAGYGVNARDNRLKVEVILRAFPKRIGKKIIGGTSGKSWKPAGVLDEGAKSINLDWPEVEKIKSSGKIIEQELTGRSSHWRKMYKDTRRFLEKHKSDTTVRDLFDSVAKENNEMEAERKRYERAAGTFEEITVVLVDAPMYYLLHGRDLNKNLYYLISFIQPSNKTVFVTSEFVRKASEEEIAQVIFIHAAQLLQAVSERTSSGQTVTQDDLDDLSKKTMADDPFKVKEQITAKAGRYKDFSLMFVLWLRRGQVRLKLLLSWLNLLRRRIWFSIAISKKSKKLKENKKVSLRDDYSDIWDLYLMLGALYEAAEKRFMAFKSYNKAFRTSIAEVASDKGGLQPLTVYFRMLQIVARLEWEVTTSKEGRTHFDFDLVEGWKRLSLLALPGMTFRDEPETISYIDAMMMHDSMRAGLEKTLLQHLDRFSRRREFNNKLRGLINKFDLVVYWERLQEKHGSNSRGIHGRHTLDMILNIREKVLSKEDEYKVLKFQPFEINSLIDKMGPAMIDTVRTYYAPENLEESQQEDVKDFLSELIKHINEVRVGRIEVIGRKREDITSFAENERKRKREKDKEADEKDNFGAVMVDIDDEVVFLALAGSWSHGSESRRFYEIVLSQFLQYCFDKAAEEKGAHAGIKNHAVWKGLQLTLLTFDAHKKLIDKLPDAKKKVADRQRKNGEKSNGSKKTQNGAHGSSPVEEQSPGSKQSRGSSPVGDNRMEGFINQVNKEIMLYEGCNIGPDPVVAIFGSARIDDPHVYSLVNILAQEEIGVITGGGSGGVMGAAHREAYRKDILSMGLTISLPGEEESGYLNRKIEFETFLARLLSFVKLAEGFVAFPGGYGTLNEIFTVLALKENCLLDKDVPLILAGEEFFRPLVNLIDDLNKRGLLRLAPDELFECYPIGKKEAIVSRILEYHGKREKNGGNSNNSIDPARIVNDLERINRQLTDIHPIVGIVGSASEDMHSYHNTLSLGRWFDKQGISALVMDDGSVGSALFEAYPREQENAHKIISLSDRNDCCEYPNHIVIPEIIEQATRKALFTHYSHCGIIFYPGDIGTLDLLLETLTHIQTKKIKPPYAMPVVLVGKDMWNPWDDFISAYSRILSDKGFVSPDDLNLFTVVDDNRAIQRIILRRYKKLKSMGVKKDSRISGSVSSPVGQEFLRELLSKNNYALSWDWNPVCSLAEGYWLRALRKGDFRVSDTVPLAVYGHRDTFLFHKMVDWDPAWGSLSVALKSLEAQNGITSSLLLPDVSQEYDSDKSVYLCLSVIGSEQTMSWLKQDMSFFPGDLIIFRPWKYKEILPLVLEYLRDRDHQISVESASRAWREVIRLWKEAAPTNRILAFEVLLIFEENNILADEEFAGSIRNTLPRNELGLFNKTADIRGVGEEDVRILSILEKYDILQPERRAGSGSSPVYNNEWSQVKNDYRDVMSSIEDARAHNAALAKRIAGSKREACYNMGLPEVLNAWGIKPHAYTTVFYPAAGNNDPKRAIQLAEAFPALERLFFIDPAYPMSYELIKKTTKTKPWLLSLLENKYPDREFKLTYISSYYYEWSFDAERPLIGSVIVLDKWPGDGCVLRTEQPFYRSLLRVTEPGDLMLTVPGGKPHYEWSAPLGRGISVPGWERRLDNWIAGLRSQDDETGVAKFTQHLGIPLSMSREILSQNASSGHRRGSSPVKNLNQQNDNHDDHGVPYYFHTSSQKYIVQGVPHIERNNPDKKSEELNILLAEMVCSPHGSLLPEFFILEIKRFVDALQEDNIVIVVNGRGEVFKDVSKVIWHDMPDRNCISVLMPFVGGSSIYVEFNGKTGKTTREVVTDYLPSRTDPGKMSFYSQRMYGPGHRLERTVYADGTQETADDYDVFRGKFSRYMDINGYNGYEVLRQTVEAMRGGESLTEGDRVELRQFVEAITARPVLQALNDAKTIKGYPHICHGISRIIKKILKDRGYSVTLVRYIGHDVLEKVIGGVRLAVDGSSGQWEGKDKRYILKGSELVAMNSSKQLAATDESSRRNLFRLTGLTIAPRLWIEQIDSNGLLIEGPYIGNKEVPYYIEYFDGKYEWIFDTRNISRSLEVYGNDGPENLKILPTLFFSMSRDGTVEITPEGVRCGVSREFVEKGIKIFYKQQLSDRAHEVRKGRDDSWFGGSIGRGGSSLAGKVMLKTEKLSSSNDQSRSSSPLQIHRTELPVGVLLDALGLTDVNKYVEKEEKWKNGAVVRNFIISSGKNGRLAFLRNQMCPWVRKFLLLMSADNRPLAVFPVLKREGPYGDNNDAAGRYMDFSPFYLPPVDFSVSTNNGIMTRSLSQYKRDQEMIDSFRSYLQSKQGIPSCSFVSKPYFYMKISDRRLVDIESISRKKLSKQIPSLRPNSKADQFLLPVYPTVYNSGEGNHFHSGAGGEYYGVILNSPDFSLSERLQFRPDDKILVVGPGPGIEIVLLALRKEGIRTIYVTGLNQLEVANTYYTASMYGIKVHTHIGDNIADMRGNPVFPGVLFNKIFWNMPVVYGLRDPHCCMMEREWDGDQRGSVLKHFAKHFPHLLAPGGQALLWNGNFSEVAHILKENMEKRNHPCDIMIEKKEWLYALYLVQSLKKSSSAIEESATGQRGRNPERYSGRDAYWESLILSRCLKGLGWVAVAGFIGWLIVEPVSARIFLVASAVKVAVGLGVILLSVIVRLRREKALRKGLIWGVFSDLLRWRNLCWTIGMIVSMAFVALAKIAMLPFIYRQRVKRSLLQTDIPVDAIRPRKPVIVIQKRLNKDSFVGMTQSYVLNGKEAIVNRTKASSPLCNERGWPHSHSGLSPPRSVYPFSRIHDASVVNSAGLPRAIISVPKGSSPIRDWSNLDTDGIFNPPNSYPADTREALFKLFRDVVRAFREPGQELYRHYRILILYKILSFQLLLSGGFLRSDDRATYPLIGLDLIPALFMPVAAINDSPQDRKRGEAMLRRLFPEHADDMLETIDSNLIYPSKRQDAFTEKSYTDITGTREKGRKVVFFSGFIFYSGKHSEVIDRILRFLARQIMQTGDLAVILDRMDVEKIGPVLENLNFVRKLHIPDISEEILQWPRTMDVSIGGRYVIAPEAFVILEKGWTPARRRGGSSSVKRGQVKDNTAQSGLSKFLEEEITRCAQLYPSDGSLHIFRHCAANAKLAKIIWEDLDMPFDYARLFLKAALKHDVGKTVDGILIEINYAGELTREERKNVIDRHPAESVRIIKETGGYFLPDVIQEYIIRNHHGIPPGLLEGTELHRLLELFTILDFLTAYLDSNRPYNFVRRDMGVEIVFAEFEQYLKDKNYKLDDKNVSAVEALQENPQALAVFEEVRMHDPDRIGDVIAHWFRVGMSTAEENIKIISKSANKTPAREQLKNFLTALSAQEVVARAGEDQLDFVLSAILPALDKRSDRDEIKKHLSTLINADRRVSSVFQEEAAIILRGSSAVSGQQRQSQGHKEAYAGSRKQQTGDDILMNLKKAGIMVDTALNIINGTGIKKFCKNHGLFYDSSPYLDNEAQNEYREFLRLGRTVWRLEQVERYILTYAGKLNEGKNVRDWVINLKKAALMSGRKQKDYITGKAGPHKHKSPSPFEWALQGANFPYVHQKRLGLLFGRIDITNLGAVDLPIWPVNKQGDILYDLIEWMRQQNKSPPVKYYLAKKSSLNQLAPYSSYSSKQLSFPFKPISSSPVSGQSVYVYLLIERYKTAEGSAVSILTLLEVVPGERAVIMTIPPESITIPDFGNDQEIKRRLEDGDVDRFIEKVEQVFGVRIDGYCMTTPESGNKIMDAILNSRLFPWGEAIGMVLSNFWECMEIGTVVMRLRQERSSKGDDIGEEFGKLVRFLLPQAAEIYQRGRKDDEKLQRLQQLLRIILDQCDSTLSEEEIMRLAAAPNVVNTLQNNINLYHVSLDLIRLNISSGSLYTLIIETQPKSSSPLADSVRKIVPLREASPGEAFLSGEKSLFREKTSRQYGKTSSPVKQRGQHRKTLDALIKEYSGNQEALLAALKDIKEHLFDMHGEEGDHIAGVMEQNYGLIIAVLRHHGLWHPLQKYKSLLPFLKFAIEQFDNPQQSKETRRRSRGASSAVAAGDKHGSSQQYPFYLLSGIGEEKAIYGMLESRVVPNVLDRFKNGELGNKIRVWSCGGVRLLEGRPMLAEAHRVIIAFMEAARKLSIVLTRDNFEVAVTDENQKELEEALNTAYHPDVFLSLTKERLLTKEARELRDRYFRQTASFDYLPNKEITQFINIHPEAETRFDAVLYNYYQHVVEAKQRIKEPILTARFANDIRNRLNEGAFLLTTAGKWFSFFLEMEMIARAMTPFMERGIRLIDIYLYRFSSIDYSREWFDEMFEKIIHNLVKKDIPVNKVFLKAAFDEAYRIHEDDKRESGEPFFVHPVRVALELSEFDKLLRHLKDNGLSLNVMFAAIFLHDALEESMGNGRDMKPLLKEAWLRLLSVDEEMAKMTGRIVLILTKHRDEKDRSFLERILRKENSGADLYAQIIKILDRLSNTTPPRFSKIEHEILNYVAQTVRFIEQSNAPDFLKEYALSILRELYTREGIATLAAYPRSSSPVKRAPASFDNGRDDDPARQPVDERRREIGASSSVGQQEGDGKERNKKDYLYKEMRWFQNVITGLSKKMKDSLIVFIEDCFRRDVFSQRQMHLLTAAVTTGKYGPELYEYVRRKYPKLYGKCRSDGFARVLYGMSGDEYPKKESFYAEFYNFLPDEKKKVVAKSFRDYVCDNPCHFVFFAIQGGLIRLKEIKQLPGYPKIKDDKDQMELLKTLFVDKFDSFAELIRFLNESREMKIPQQTIDRRFSRLLTKLFILNDNTCSDLLVRIADYFQPEALMYMRGKKIKEFETLLKNDIHDFVKSYSWKHIPVPALQELSDRKREAMILAAVFDGAAYRKRLSPDFGVPENGLKYFFTGKPAPPRTGALALLRAELVPVVKKDLWDFIDKDLESNRTKKAYARVLKKALKMRKMYGLTEIAPHIVVDEISGETHLSWKSPDVKVVREKESSYRTFFTTLSASGRLWKALGAYAKNIYKKLRIWADGHRMTDELLRVRVIDGEVKEVLFLERGISVVLSVPVFPSGSWTDSFDRVRVKTAHTIYTVNPENGERAGVSYDLKGFVLISWKREVRINKYEKGEYIVYNRVHPSGQVNMLGKTPCKMLPWRDAYIKAHIKDGEVFKILIVQDRDARPCNIGIELLQNKPVCVPPPGEVFEYPVLNGDNLTEDVREVRKWIIQVLPRLRKQIRQPREMMIQRICGEAIDIISRYGQTKESSPGLKMLLSVVEKLLVTLQDTSKKEDQERTKQLGDAVYTMIKAAGRLGLFRIPGKVAIRKQIPSTVRTHLTSPSLIRIELSDIESWLKRLKREIIRLSKKLEDSGLVNLSNWRTRSKKRAAVFLDKIDKGPDFTGKQDVREILEEIASCFTMMPQVLIGFPNGTFKDLSDLFQQEDISNLYRVCLTSSNENDNDSVSQSAADGKRPVGASSAVRQEDAGKKRNKKEHLYKKMRWFQNVITGLSEEEKGSLIVFIEDCFRRGVLSQRQMHLLTAVVTTGKYGPELYEYVRKKYPKRYGKLHERTLIRDLHDVPGDDYPEKESLYRELYNSLPAEKKKVLAGHFRKYVSDHYRDFVFLAIKQGLIKLEEVKQLPGYPDEFLLTLFTDKYDSFRALGRILNKTTGTVHYHLNRVFELFLQPDNIGSDLLMRITEHLQPEALMYMQGKMLKDYEDVLAPEVKKFAGECDWKNISYLKKLSVEDIESMIQRALFEGRNYKGALFQGRNYKVLADDFGVFWPAVRYFFTGIPAPPRLGALALFRSELVRKMKKELEDFRGEALKKGSNGKVYESVIKEAIKMREMYHLSEIAMHIFVDEISGEVYLSWESPDAKIVREKGSPYRTFFTTLSASEGLWGALGADAKNIYKKLRTWADGRGMTEELVRVRVIDGEVREVLFLERGISVVLSVPVFPVGSWTDSFDAMRVKTVRTIYTVKPGNGAIAGVSYDLKGFVLRSWKKVGINIQEDNKGEYIILTRVPPDGKMSIAAKTRYDIYAWGGTIIETRMKDGESVSMRIVQDANGRPCNVMVEVLQNKPVCVPSLDEVFGYPVLNGEGPAADMHEVHKWIIQVLPRLREQARQPDRRQVLEIKDEAEAIISKHQTEEDFSPRLKMILPVVEELSIALANTFNEKSMESKTQVYDIVAGVIKTTGRLGVFRIYEKEKKRIKIPPKDNLRDWQWITSLSLMPLDDQVEELRRLLDYVINRDTTIPWEDVVSRRVLTKPTRNMINKQEAQILSHILENKTDSLEELAQFFNKSKKEMRRILFGRWQSGQKVHYSLGAICKFRSLVSLLLTRKAEDLIEESIGNDATDFLNNLKGTMAILWQHKLQEQFLYWRRIYQVPISVKMHLVSTIDNNQQEVMYLARKPLSGATIRKLAERYRHIMLFESFGLSPQYYTRLGSGINWRLSEWGRIHGNHDQFREIYLRAVENGNEEVQVQVQEVRFPENGAVAAMRSITHQSLLMFSDRGFPEECADNERARLIFSACDWLRELLTVSEHFVKNSHDPFAPVWVRQMYEEGMHFSAMFDKLKGPFYYVGGVSPAHIAIDLQKEVLNRKAEMEQILFRLKRAYQRAIAAGGKKSGNGVPSGAVVGLNNNSSASSSAVKGEGTRKLQRWVEHVLLILNDRQLMELVKYVETALKQRRINRKQAMALKDIFQYRVNSREEFERLRKKLRNGPITFRRYLFGTIGVREKRPLIYESLYQELSDKDQNKLKRLLLQHIWENLDSSVFLPEFLELEQVRSAVQKSLGQEFILNQLSSTQQKILEVLLRDTVFSFSEFAEKVGIYKNNMSRNVKVVARIVKDMGHKEGWGKEQACLLAEKYAVRSLKYLRGNQLLSFSPQLEDVLGNVLAARENNLGLEPIRVQALVKQWLFGEQSYKELAGYYEVDYHKLRNFFEDDLGTDISQTGGVLLFKHFLSEYYSQQIQERLEVISSSDRDEQEKWQGLVEKIILWRSIYQVPFLGPYLAIDNQSGRSIYVSDLRSPGGPSVHEVRKLVGRYKDITLFGPFDLLKQSWVSERISPLDRDVYPSVLEWAKLRGRSQEMLAVRLTMRGIVEIVFLESRY